MLSFNMKEIMVPQNDCNLIGTNPSSGPTFGGGPDLFVSDECNTNYNSHANFPTTYNRIGG